MKFKKLVKADENKKDYALEDLKYSKMILKNNLDRLAKHCGVLEKLLEQEKLEGKICLDLSELVDNFFEGLKEVNRKYRPLD